MLAFCRRFIPSNFARWIIQEDVTGENGFSRLRVILLLFVCAWLRGIPVTFKP